MSLIATYREGKIVIQGYIFILFIATINTVPDGGGGEGGLLMLQDFYPFFPLQLLLTDKGRL